MKRLNFDELIERISLPEYLIYKGYKINKRKSTRVHKVFGKDKNGKDDEIIVTKHKLPPHNWVYKSVSDPDSDKGNIINFAVNRVNGYVSTLPKQKTDYKKVSETLNDYIGIPAEEINKFVETYKNEIQVENKREPFNYHLFGAKKLEDFNYLISRGIEKSDIENDLFSGKIIEAKYAYKDNKTEEWVVEQNYNTSFPLFTSTNEVVGIQIHRGNDKRLGPNSNREIGVWKSNYTNKTNTIAIGEEAIDCISHSKMHNPNGNISYMATFGSPSLKHSNVLEKEIIDNGIRNLLLINDNDRAGQEFNLHYLLHFINKEHNVKIVDTDKRSILIEFDKASFKDNNLLKMIMAFKMYNQRKEKEISDYSKSLDTKQNLLKRDSFKTINNANKRFQVAIPRDKNALYLFNKQLLGAIGGKTESLRMKIELPITKDWNDDLNLKEDQKNTLVAEEKQDKKNVAKKSI